jgi:hypothetical protein
MPTNRNDWILIKAASRGGRQCPKYNSQQARSRCNLSRNGHEVLTEMHGNQVAVLASAHLFTRKGGDTKGCRDPIPLCLI